MEKKTLNPIEEISKGSDEHSDAEEVSDLLGAAVDYICESTKAKRQTGLRSLIKYLLLNTEPEHLNKYEMTLNSSLFNCMRKGKVDERCEAAYALALLVFQHGDSDLSEEILEKAARYARRILIDTRKDDYSVFIKAIAIIYFVASSDSADTLEFMCLLLSIADKAAENKVDEQVGAAIRAWTFLFITVPSQDLGGFQFIENALHLMYQYLFSSSTAVRLAAGEAITVMFTSCNLGSIHMEDTKGDEDVQKTGLGTILMRMREIEKNIGEDNRKSKKDRTEQRSEFREFLKIIDGQTPKERKISLSNGQSIIIDQFTGLITIDMLIEFLGEGFQHHLQNNQILHDLLDFEPAEFRQERGSSIDKISKQKARNETRRLCAAYKRDVML